VPTTTSDARAQARTTARRLIFGPPGEPGTLRARPAPVMARFEHPLSKRLGTPTDPRAGAAAGLDQSLAAEKVERAHDRRPADVEFLGESAFRGETRTRPQPPNNDRGAQLVRNVCIAHTGPRPAAARHIQAYASGRRGGSMKTEADEPPSTPPARRRDDPRRGKPGAPCRRMGP
jgi:hypothetical protein